MTEATEPDRSGSPRDSSEETLLALLQRERADFQNFKRRVVQERNEDRERARRELLAGLLPFLDDLDRALEHVPPELARHPWVQGLVLSRRQLGEFLERAGVQRYGAPGDRFDPNLHEAVAYDVRPGLAEPVVADVIRPGYRAGERVLRPAHVIVAGPS